MDYPMDYPKPEPTLINAYIDLEAIRKNIQNLKIIKSADRQIPY